ncbi:uncharacterized protein A1O9_09022 [Exophiala aquamarina CBS 119918]|uniref:glutathione transferase n=1 Tax=Exophiala aquamarina CBS 119918 TaxID=1182545 RepID=A0A072PG88_9EURO|nr:uncharacterized protein A1O9_09022 [Exophiala aquamarina CBS 119918]KEF54580.1 hypothetical protein A1O9_09022 [Exophiala aquamarina CBS 119918]
MTRYVLHADYLSPYCITVAFTLLEKQLCWVYEEVKLLDLKTRTPEHKLKHPWGKIPVLDVIEQDGSEFRICESRAICRYLALLHQQSGSKLLPDCGNVTGFARFEEAAAFESCYFTPPVWKVTGEICMKPLLGFGPPDPLVVDASWLSVEESLHILNDRLAHQPYLAGESFSLVDIWTMPWFAQLLRVKGRAETLGPHSNIQFWWNKVTERPAWKKARDLMEEACRVLGKPPTNA